MSKPDYRHFLAVLENKEEQKTPTLFEPFVADALAEQLIWRRGKQLWDTPAHYADTMLSLRERTDADVVILDARRFPRENEIKEMLNAAENGLIDGAALVVLCQTEAQQKTAEPYKKVCAVGGYDRTKPESCPFIRMDKTPEYAKKEGAAAWYASSNAELYYRKYKADIAILGGIGADWCGNAEPLAIHRTVMHLVTVTKNRGFMIGSGGQIPENAYLSLISLLGIYAKYR